MSAITLTVSGSTPLVFTNEPRFPLGEGDVIAVAVLRTASNTLKRYYKGTPGTVVELEWTAKNPLNPNDYNGGFDVVSNTQNGGTQSLRNLFNNVALGATNVMTYTDRYGGQRSAIFLDQQLKFSYIEGGGYVGKLRLWVQPDPNSGMVENAQGWKIILSAPYVDPATGHTVVDQNLVSPTGAVMKMSTLDPN